jgi:hypothetical protein
MSLRTQLEAGTYLVCAVARDESMHTGPYRRGATANNPRVFGDRDNDDDEDDENRTGPGTTVMAFVWGDTNTPTMCAIVVRRDSVDWRVVYHGDDVQDADGELRDTLKLHHLYRIKTQTVDDQGTRITGVALCLCACVCAQCDRDPV